MVNGLQVFDMEQGSPEWLQARCGMITASTVGKLITAKTLKPADNDTSRSLCTLLASERITKHVEETFTTDDMWRGRELEPKARDLYSQHYAPVTEVGFMVRTFGLSSLGYSPDGLVGDDGLIEIKSPRPANHLATLLTGQVPARYVPQVQAGLLVSGRDWLDFISYSPGLPLFVTRVLPDLDYQAALLEAVVAANATIDEIIADYHDKVRDLVPTERVDPNKVELKL